MFIKEINLSLSFLRPLGLKTWQKGLLSSHRSQRLSTRGFLVPPEREAWTTETWEMSHLLCHPAPSSQSTRTIARAFPPPGALWENVPRQAWWLKTSFWYWPFKRIWERKNTYPLCCDTDTHKWKFMTDLWLVHVGQCLGVARIRSPLIYAAKQTIK